MGTISTYMASGGFSVISFEPMMFNEAAFRATICANQLMERITLVPMGLGHADAVSGGGVDQGDGGSAGELKVRLRFHPSESYFLVPNCPGKRRLSTVAR